MERKFAKRAPHPLDGVAYRHVRDVVQSIPTVVVVVDDEGGKGLFRQDERLWIRGVPLGPLNPETYASVGV
jgi:hypothetical protein